jgi:hypothetical protein
MKTLIALAGSIILGALAAGSATAAQAPFVGPTEYATGGTPWGVWATDLNGDGRRDVLTLDGSNAISVLLGTGDGSFERKRSYKTPSVDIADIADLNGDKRPDLVIASSEEDEPIIAVLLNAGNGSFPARHTYRTGGPVAWFAIDDVNGDGEPDLVTANSLSDDSGDEDSAVQGSVSVLLNKGDGSFRPRRDYELEHSPSEFALDDLNHDGLPDLVITTEDDDIVSVFLNRDGGFGAGRDYKTGPEPATLEVHDLNGDGRPDLVTLSSYSDNEDSANGSVSVLLNSGDGSFGARHDYETGDSPVSLVIGDLNGDRRADLVTSNSGDGSVSVLVNKGDGSFGATRDYPVGGDAAPVVAISDLNGDGSPDLVALAQEGESDTVSLLVNNGEGGFRAKRDFETGRGPVDLALGDLNGDGRRDIVVADGGQLAVSVLLNTMGDGAPFAAPPGVFPHASEYGTSGTSSVAVGDVNGDGRPDIVGTNRVEGTVSVLLGREDGFADVKEYDVGRAPRSVAIGDLNGDGAPDLAVANTRDDTISVLLNQRDGSFKKQHDYPTGHRPFVVAIADLDRDGTQDLATGDAGPIGGLTVSVLLNVGDGTFANRHAYRTPRAPISIAIGDLNGDGLPDLVTGNHLRRSVTVLLNAGHGTFAGRRSYQVGRYPGSVAIGDLNHDGAPDLAVANTRDASVSVLLNAGHGTFGEKRDYPTGSSPSSVVIGDFDGDGVPDLATNDPDGWTVHILPGKGDGSFQDLLEYPVPGSPRVLATGDVNGDGRPDLVAALVASVAVYVNSAGK